MADLNASELGTEEYWAKTYEEELQDFQENGSIGFVWFGMKSVKSVTNWIKNSNLVDSNDAILEIGCGNGILLKELYNNGYRNLKGLDYVKSAIDLAKAIAQKDGIEIYFEVNDILRDLNLISDETRGCLIEKYKVILDKGTFDAILLSQEDTANKRLKYAENVHCLLENNGLFIICSCNLVKEELLVQFKNGFEFLDEVIFPQIQFGGKTGTTLTLIVFKKIPKNT